MHKCASSWLTVIPLKDLDYTLSKREFRDKFHWRYDWQIKKYPFHSSVGISSVLTYDMICRRSGFIIQRHNQLRDLEAEMLNDVCHDVDVEPVLQEFTGEVLPRGSTRAPDAGLDIHARGF